MRENKSNGSVVGHTQMHAEEVGKKDQDDQLSWLAASASVAAAIAA